MSATKKNHYAWLFELEVGVASPDALPLAVLTAVCEGIIGTVVADRDAVLTISHSGATHNVSHATLI